LREPGTAIIFAKENARPSASGFGDAVNEAEHREHGEEQC